MNTRIVPDDLSHKHSDLHKNTLQIAHCAQITAQLRRSTNEIAVYLESRHPLSSQKLYVDMLSYQ